MKKVPTIFIYISIALFSFLAVFSLIFSVIGIIYQITNPYYDFILTFGFIIYMVLLLVFCAIGITVGALTLKKLKIAKTKSEMFTLSILCLIFCNVVSGILLLCMEDKDFSGETSEVKEEKNLNKLEEKLLKLEKMKNNGLISQEEYVELRKKVIDSEF